MLPLMYPLNNIYFGYIIWFIFFVTEKWLRWPRAAVLGPMDRRTARRDNGRSTIDLHDAAGVT